MAFSSTLLFKGMVGERWISWGTWDGSGVSTGDIETQLDYTELLVTNYSGNAVKSNAISVDESFPVDGGSITIDFDSGEAGVWIALGRA